MALERRTKFIILVTYCMFCIIIGFVIAIFSTPICLREECIDKSVFVLSNMDMKADPCKDFYKYVCGNSPRYSHVINKTNPIMKYDDNLNSLYKRMIESVENYLRYLAGSGKVPPEIVQNLYHETVYLQFNKICEQIKRDESILTKTDVGEKLQQTLIGTNMTVKDIFSPKKFNPLVSAGILEYKLRTTGFFGKHLFNSLIKRDENNPNSFALYISKALNFEFMESKKLFIYDRKMWMGIIGDFTSFFLVDTEDMFASDKSDHKLVLEKVVDLWFDMVQLSKTVEDMNATVEVVRMDEIQKRFPHLDFDGLLREMGANNMNRRHIYIEPDSKNFFAKLRNVLDKYDRQVQVVFQFWQCIWDLTPFLRFPTLLTSTLQGLEIQNTYPCSKTIWYNLKGILLSLMIERFKITRYDSDAMENTFNYLLKVMRSLLGKSSWMDSKTKSSGTAKLDAMKQHISIPKKQFDSIKTNGQRFKFYYGLCIKPSVLSTLLCVNSFFTKKNYGLFTREITGFDEAATVEMGNINYNQENNRFTLPINILRFPAFEATWPNHVNYGGLGIEVASELITGFDFEGSKWNKFGIKHAWWTNNTYENYKKMEHECESTGQKIWKKSYKAQGTTHNVKNGQIFTDKDFIKGEMRKPYWKKLMGVKIAFEAYVANKKNITYKESKLPGFEQLSFEQGFFIAHAHMHCLYSDPGHYLMRVYKTYFQALSNLKEFKEAFGCSSNSDRKAAVFSKLVRKCTFF